MTKEEHRAKHVELHKALDELIADFLIHECSYPSTRMPSNITLMELMAWSHEQTIDPKGND